ncbi:MAG: ABC transporter substrate-binding protein [Ruminococcus sp.]|nr:ABC transporter substrate-binding protein [Candidatus Apopatosoma intestinale]
MKKLLCMLLVLSMALLAFTACGGDNGKDATIYEKAQEMTWDELFELAKAETGDFNAYGNTSRIKDAMTAFVAKYGAELGLSDSNAVGTKMSDSEIYTTIESEYQSAGNSKGASMVMIQDGATLLTYINGTEYFANYVPKAYADKLDKSAVTPLVQQYINKLIMWNNVGSDSAVITNVWQLTEASMKGKVYFKSPKNEQVNMNFLIMCTSKEWSDKLADAYKAYFGKNIELGTYKNAGYKWVAEFLNNANFSINSDTTIAGDLSKPENTGKAGLFVLSKLRDKSVVSDNLTVAAFADGVAPFSGFMYPMYCQIAQKGPRPYTAMLFIEYLMTEEGFQPWGKSIGAYSSNPALAALEGDQPLSFWMEKLVFEDPQYIMDNKAEITDFVNKIIG